MGGYTPAPPQGKQNCPISTAPPSHSQVLLRAASGKRRRGGGRLRRARDAARGALSRVCDEGASY